MEEEGARRIFKRSVERNKLRYTEDFGDGYSKSHGFIQDIYNSGANGAAAVRKECVCHVQK